MGKGALKSRSRYKVCLLTNDKHKQKHTNTNIEGQNVLADKHTNTHIQTNTQTHTYKHTHTNTHRYKHVQTHQNTHTRKNTI